jgi:hypothetical protein
MSNTWGERTCERCGVPGASLVVAGSVSSTVGGRLGGVAFAGLGHPLGSGCGGTRPDTGGLTRHNLHSVCVGENLRRPHRYAVSPTKS